MITDLNVLSIGSPWPINEKIANRAYQLEQYEKCFEGDHSEVYKEQFRRVSRVIGNFEDVYQYDIEINYHKKISIKTADLLLGEEPDVELPKEIDEDGVKVLIEKTGYWATMFEAVLDVSRYGCAVLKISSDITGPMIDIVPAKYWIPVVDPLNQKRVINHIIAWTDCEAKTLTLQVHYKGYYEVRVHKLNNSNMETKIGALVSTAIIQTGLDDFAIVVLNNSTSSSSIYGISDYRDIDTIISELEVRVSQISKILDKHADPSLAVPESCVDIDPVTDTKSLKLGNTFIIESKDDVKPEYIVWDGSLESNFEQFKVLKKELANVSEMGPFIDVPENTGNLSGIALKKLFFQPLSKVSRLATKLQSPMVKVIKLLSQLYGTNMTDKSISISFRDGLPTDYSETVKYLTEAVKGGIMSKQTAIKMLHDGISEENVQKELDLINGVTTTKEEE